MVHPATRRSALAAITAIGSPVDIGFVFPPKDGEVRGRGIWTGRNLTLREVSNLLARAAAANAQGGAIYMRLGPECRVAHPAVLLLDDLTAAKVDELKADGFFPRVVVETSPGNFQAWMALLADGTLPYRLALVASRALAQRYGADLRAVSPLQPGRLPGFTNRKPKYASTDGQFPFVKLVEVHPRRIAERGAEFLARLETSKLAQPARAAHASPETPPVAATSFSGALMEAEYENIYRQERERIMAEFARGDRPAAATSASEIDFAVAVRCLELGWSADILADVISALRPTKADDYGWRTTQAAAQQQAFAGRSFHPGRTSASC